LETDKFGIISLANMVKIFFSLLVYLFWFVPCVLLCFIIFRVFNRTQIRGKENIPKKGGMLIMANHVSALDSFLIGPIFFPRMAFFPAKIELFKNPLLSIMYKGWGAFPVLRGRYNVAVMKKIVELSQDNIVIIHPEGTRSRDGEIGQGSKGVGKIIYETNAPVIPLCANGMEKFLPVHKRFPSFFKLIIVNIGKPMNFSHYKNLEPTKETYKMIVDELIEELKKLKTR